MWRGNEKEYRMEEWQWGDEWWREWEREREMWDEYEELWKWNEYEKLWKWNEYKEIDEWDVEWKYNRWIEEEYDCNKLRKKMINEYNDENKKNDEYLS